MQSIFGNEVKMNDPEMVDWQLIDGPDIDNVMPQLISSLWQGEQNEKQDWKS